MSRLLVAIVPPRRGQVPHCDRDSFPLPAASLMKPLPRSNTYRAVARGSAGDMDVELQAREPLDCQPRWAAGCYGALIKQKQYSSTPPEPSPGARKCSLSTMWL